MPASKYKPAYCNEVIQYLAEGHSITAFAGHIGVHRSVVIDWTKRHEDFGEALEIGKAKAVAFWEKILIGIARDGGGNATAAIFGLKNRATSDWSDRTVTEHSGPNGGPIQTQEVKARDALASRIAGLAARTREKENTGKPE